MVIQWREIQHEDVDRYLHGDLVSQQALKMRGLYKFWNIGSMMAKPRLLQMLINYWYPDTKAFVLYGMPLNIKVEDIYFIIGLSC